MNNTLTLSSLGKTPPPFTVQGDGLEIVVLHGDDAAKSAPLEDAPVVVGGHPDCDLVLTNLTVSRRHLKIARTKEGIVLEDLGSKNGSFVGGKRVERAVIECGAEFYAGDALLKLVPRERVVDPEPLDVEAFGGLVGASPAMQKLFTLIERIAPSEASVLLQGQTGAGKEVVAEEIHRRSTRANKPFVIFDCGAVPDELIESTLFGHTKGAFTGAQNDKSGVLRDADGGTVFLDEIGELKLELQPALLRVLDRGMVRPVGATAYEQVDVRVIAATHRNLGEHIQRGEFREDLYYRLAVVRMAVPALIERREDIPLLVRHFLSRLGRQDIEVTTAAIDMLRKHSWPGNVRELRNVVERGVALSMDGRLSKEAIDASGGLALPGEAPAAAPAGRPKGPRKAFRDAKAEAVEGFERTYLKDLMEDFDSISQAADAAQMDRKHLRTLLRRYGLVPE